MDEIDKGIGFELFCATMITKQLNVSFEDIQDSLVGGGNDGGIDAFIILINDDCINSLDQLSSIKINGDTKLHILINQSKRENSFTESTIDKLLASVPIIFSFCSVKELNLRFNQGLLEKVLIFRKLWESLALKGGHITVSYSYSCLASERTFSKAYEHKIEQLVRDTKSQLNVSKVNCTFANLSCTELLKSYQYAKSNRLKLTFKQPPLSISYGKSGIGYIGVVKLSDFYDFIKENGNIREDLFESNIRHYQGEVDVNNKIKNTLLNDTVRDFWWLNNGVTIIATDPYPFGESLTIDNIQIVNGLQTSYSIGQHYNSPQEEHRSVLVKVVINSDKETVDKIIASTNDQNAVSPTLLRASDDTQKNLEMYFLSKGYFYDRRKNFYKNQGKPLNKIVSIQFTAQAIESVLYSNPSAARSKPTTLIKDNSSYKRIFNTDISFEAYLRCCQIVQNTFELFSKEQNNTRIAFSNFKLHIARIYASLLLQKPTFQAHDLISLDIKLFNSATLKTSIMILDNCIDQYMGEHPEELLSNISKSKSFDAIMLKLIEQTYDIV
ncbi:AIPR family protein [Mucilaginibacter pedocola]|uniref:AIPR family protein n=1 Tax=Mucilaginibacter pedocola TaxID=1792845 RepID=UPI00138FC76A|nr:AIPR family protein [Mucilaginibacter pedocola]